MDNYVEVIEKFISNELKGEKLAWFQDQLRNNKDFVAQYKLHIDINAAIEEDDIMQLRNKLNDIYNNFREKENKTGKILRFKQLSVAAVVFIIIGITGLMILYKNQNLSSEDLYASYYTPYETIINVRSVDKNMEDKITQAFGYYQEKEYSEALELFNEILTEEPNNIFILFYSAIAEMEVGNTTKAIQKLETIINDKNNLFIQQSEWYLSLCYLKVDNKEKATSLLQKIILKDGYYRAKSEELLKNI
ncbi:tol-pal system YbgF family protein [Bacteroidota bacterium]